MAAVLPMRANTLDRSHHFALGAFRKLLYNASTYSTGADRGGGALGALGAHIFGQYLVIYIQEPSLHPATERQT